MIVAKREQSQYNEKSGVKNRHFKERRCRSSLRKKRTIPIQWESGGFSHHFFYVIISLIKDSFKKGKISYETTSKDVSICRRNTV